MRTEDEVQRAHDTLVDIVLEPRLMNIVGLSPEEEKIVIGNLDVLCWLLGHDHNQTFANNLRLVEKRLAEQGLVQVRMEELSRRRGTS